MGSLEGNGMHTARPWHCKTLHTQCTPPPARFLHPLQQLHGGFLKSVTWCVCCAMLCAPHTLHVVAQHHGMPESGCTALHRVPRHCSTHIFRLRRSK